VGWHSYGNSGRQRVSAVTAGDNVFRAVNISHHPVDAANPPLFLNLQISSCEQRMLMQIGHVTSLPRTQPPV